MNADRNKEKRTKKTDKDKENKMLEETAHKV